MKFVVKKNENEKMVWIKEERKNQRFCRLAGRASSEPISVCVCVCCGTGDPAVSLRSRGAKIRSAAFIGSLLFHHFLLSLRWVPAYSFPVQNSRRDSLNIYGPALLYIMSGCCGLCVCLRDYEGSSKVTRDRDTAAEWMGMGRKVYSSLTVFPKNSSFPALCAIMHHCTCARMVRTDNS